MTTLLQQNSPQAQPTFLGLDRTTVITLIVSILVPVVVTIFGVWLAKKWRDKLRVKIASKLNWKQFEQLSALYCERVPDYERVPPNHFRAFFRREHSASSIRDFRRRITSATDPVHLLITARDSTDIRGFLKAIFIPDVRCLFIAYLVTAPGKNHEQRGVTQQIISKLFAACRGSTIQSIVYEVCVEPKSNHRAKARLFQHYAAIYGVKLRRIAAKYQQPEICSFEAGDCRLTNAELYVAQLGDQAHNTVDGVPRAAYEKLVSSIYSNVYLASYALSEPQLKEKYRDFLQRAMRQLFSGIRDTTIGLK